MKLKKTENANLEKKRPTLMLIGLTLAFAITLQSFEWAGAEFKEKEIASALQEELQEEVVQEMELFRPKKTVNKPMPKNNEFVEITEKKLPVEETQKKEIEDVLPDLEDDVFVDDDDLIDTGYFDPEDNERYVIVDKMPEFPGGLDALYEFLGKNIVYPEISASAGSEGQALINFTIEKDGSITDIHTVGGSADKYCQKEAERVVKKMPNWKPGKQRERPVRVSFVLPIRFKLN